MSDRIIPPGRLSRRQFCKAAGAGVLVFALPACFGDGVRRIGTGNLDDAGADDLSLSPNADLAGQPPRDLSMSGARDMSMKNPPDMAQQMNSCPGGVYNTNMAPGSFSSGTATYFSSQDLFVCRDSGGLFAVSSICTHAGCSLTWKTSGHFYCPCHGATFSLTGSVTGGPTSQPLDHYLVCLNNGHVAVDPGSIVSSSSRLVA